jgi:AbrB family looped-hinge helix DNA binding protein
MLADWQQRPLLKAGIGSQKRIACLRPGEISLRQQYINNVADMKTKLTTKGQVTIPKHIREAAGLEPGATLEFTVNYEDQIVISKVGRSFEDNPNRFEAARGKATIKWRAAFDE